MGLGCVAIAIAPIIWGALGRGRPAVSGTRARGTPQIEVPGASLVEAVRSRVFWILSAISMLAGLGMSGPVAHWVPFLRDRAMTATDAAACMSLLGLSSIAGRLIAGATLDRVSGPLVGLPLLGFGAVGIILAVSSGVAVAAPAILLLGFAVGSEFDVLAYFVSRYFGLRSHATVFGWTYGMVALGAAIGPVVVGALRDRQGDYAMGFILSGACLAVAALLCPLLGRYRYVP
jgi:cyanate permease